MSRAWPWLLVVVAGVLLVLVWRREQEPPRPEPAPAPAAAAPGTRQDPEGRVELKLPDGWQVEWRQTGPKGTELGRVHHAGEEGAEVRVFWSRVPVVNSPRLYTKAIQMASARDERVVDGRHAEERGRIVVELETRSPREGTPSHAGLVRFVGARGRLLQVRARAPVGRFPALRPALQAIVDGASLR